MLFLFAALVHGCAALVGPAYYANKLPVSLLWGTVTSDTTQLPYEYASLPFTCPRTPQGHSEHLNLGQVLRGERAWDPALGLVFGTDVVCQKACLMMLDRDAASAARELIHQGYVVEWTLDGLPAATTFVNAELQTKHYAAGFPLGFVENGQAYLNNHVMLVVRYHREPHGYSIVGVEAYPRSVADGSCPGAKRDYDHYAVPDHASPIGLTYSVQVFWREEPAVSWATRWQMYYDLEALGTGIHWLSLVNSAVFVCLLLAVVVVVLVKTVSRDIDNAHLLSAEPSGWKKLTRDVTCRPNFSTWLLVLGGVGLQMVVTAYCVTLLSALGIVGNFAPGSVVLLGVGMFVLTGAVAGYVSVWLYRHLGGDSSGKRVAVLAGGFLPGVAVALCIALSTVLWGLRASTALPFGTIALLLFCVLCEVLLSVGGGLVAAHKVPERAREHYAGTVPRQPFFVRLPVAMAMFGVIPFGVVYVEMLFIFNALWLEKTLYYYKFGFLLATLVFLAVVVGELAVVLVYLALQHEDPRWSWRAFLVGSAVGWYMFVYAGFYYATKLHVDGWVLGVLFFGYAGVACVGVGVACGAVGLVAAGVFVNKIYSAIKVE